MECNVGSKQPDSNARSEIMDTLKGAALVGTFIGVLNQSSPCGCRYGRMCGKPQSSPPAPISIRLVLVPQTALHP